MLARPRCRSPSSSAVHVVCEALKGLDYAHRRTDDEGKPLGIVHRDVSPSNVLVSFEGEVKVCDFGIARANDVIGDAHAGSAAHELGEALKGKAGYMSPEHARGEAIDARADVFAAGIVLWELAAGRRMYKAGEGRDSLLDQARRANVPELPQNGLPAEDKLRRDRRQGARGAAATRATRRRRPCSATSTSYAVSARLMTSPLELGEWLKTTFGEEILGRRRARERADRGARERRAAGAPGGPPRRPRPAPIVADGRPAATDLGPLRAEAAPPRRRRSLAVLILLTTLAAVMIALTQRR